MIDLIKRVFSHATIACGTGFVAALYTGDQWINQEFDRLDFLEIIDKSSGFSIVSSSGKTGFIIRTAMTEDTPGITPALKPVPYNGPGEEFEQSGDSELTDEVKKFIEDFLNKAVPPDKVVSISTLGKMKQARKIINAMQAAGFICDLDIMMPDERVNEGFVAFYIDQASRIPAEISGNLKQLFCKLVELSGFCDFDTKPSSGYLTLNVHF